jgi:hypothetical protein
LIDTKIPRIGYDTGDFLRLKKVFPKHPICRNAQIFPHFRTGGRSFSAEIRMAFVQYAAFGGF